jgi:hypothetical protein
MHVFSSLRIADALSIVAVAYFAAICVAMMAFFFLAHPTSATSFARRAKVAKTPASCVSCFVVAILANTSLYL